MRATPTSGAIAKGHTELTRAGGHGSSPVRCEFKYIHTRIFARAFTHECTFFILDTRAHLRLFTYACVCAYTLIPARIDLCAHTYVYAHSVDTQHTRTRTHKFGYTMEVSHTLTKERSLQTCSHTLSCLHPPRAHRPGCKALHACAHTHSYLGGL